MRNNLDRLKYLLKARTECIWVKTYEEISFLEDFKELLSISINSIEKKDKITNNNFKLYTWSNMLGSKEIQLKSYLKESPPIMNDREFQAFFNTKLLTSHKIIESNSYDDSYESNNTDNFFVLFDFHNLIKEPKVQRAIRDLKENIAMREEYNPIIVVSPSNDIPSDIARLFEIIDYDLPSKQYIEDYLSVVVNGILLDSSCDNPDIQTHSEEEIKEFANLLAGLTFKEIDSVCKQSLVEFRRLDKQFISNHKIQVVKKTQVLNYINPSCKLSDIGGNEAIKDWLLEQKELFTKEAKEFGLDTPKGIMLTGIAGCGKTKIAEAYAGELQLPLIEFSISKIMNKLVGESEKKIVQALDIVKSCAPCVLLLDEVEKIFSGVENSRNDGGVTARVMQEILKFMNNNDSGIYVIMTSNNIDMLPPEFTRAGRLDAIWYFGMPGPKARKEIFNIHLKAKNKELPNNLISLAVNLTNNYTGAEIQQAVKNILRITFVRSKKDNNKDIIAEDIKKGISEVTPVFNVSRAKILAIENFCKGRALNTVYPEENNNKEKSNRINFINL